MDKIHWEAIRTNPGIPCAVWWQTQEEYWCAVPLDFANQNTHIIVFRPGAKGRPPAIWIFQGQQAVGGTLVIDDRGVLQYTDELVGSRVKLINGILELDSLSGSFVIIDADGFLDLAEVESGGGALFVTDLATKNERPHLVGYDGFVRELEVGDNDDTLSDGTGGQVVNARMRSRPFIYRDPLRRKKPAIVRLSALPEDPEAEITVRLFGDGAQFQARTITVTRGDATEPKAGSGAHGPEARRARSRSRSSSRGGSGSRRLRLSHRC